MTKSYIPGSGTEGEWFFSRYCYECKCDRKFRESDDGADSCQIMMKTYLHKPGDAEYPPEWICDDDGGNARCTAFEDIQKEPEPEVMHSCAVRDDQTIDMFD